MFKISLGQQAYVAMFRDYTTTRSRVIDLIKFVLRGMHNRNANDF